MTHPVIDPTQTVEYRAGYEDGFTDGQDDMRDASYELAEKLTQKLEFWIQNLDRNVTHYELRGYDAATIAGATGQREMARAVLAEIEFLTEVGQ